VDSDQCSVASEKSAQSAHNPLTTNHKPLATNRINLIVEIKGYRGEDAKEKKSTMDTYWVPGVNNLGSYGRWAFAEFTDVFQMQDDFADKVEAELNRMIDNLFLDGATDGHE
jgi:hypothetical protein